MADEERKTMKEDLKWLLGRVLNDYYRDSKIEEKLTDIKFEDAYQDNLIKFFMSDITNEYVDTPLTESEGVKLLYVKNGLILIKQIIPAVTKVEDSKLMATEKIKLTSSNLLDTNDENYQSNSVEIPLDLPLYNFNGTYDEINGTDLIIRCKEFNLDGNEEWQYENSYENTADNYLVCRFSTVLDLSESLLSYHILSNEFDTVDYMVRQKEGISITDNNKVYLNIKINKISNMLTDGQLGDNKAEARISELKEYLAKNPIKFICKRKTPLIESIGANPYSLIAYEGDTYIIIEEINNCIPQIMFSYNIKAEYREAIANASTQALSNDDDVNNNIVPYLMDMEMNLMSLDENNGGDDI